MSKRLIINADDFGLSEDINKGIIECYRHGVVTDLSLLAIGSAFSHAVKLARENNVNKIGVHLAFSENYRMFLLKYFIGFIKLDEIYMEFKDQISKIKKEGLKITHLDSHEHIHVVPGILKIVIRLMKEEDIGYVRFPLERLNVITKFMDLRGWVRNILLSSICRLSKKILDASNVKHNDSFIGHARALRLKRKDLVNAISNLKDGLTELCCHPRNSSEELNVLCDRSFIDEIKKYSIELVSY